MPIHKRVTIGISFIIAFTLTASYLFAEKAPSNDPMLHIVEIPVLDLLEQSSLKSELTEHKEIFEALSAPKANVKINYIIEKRPIAYATSKILHTWSEGYFTREHIGYLGPMKYTPMQKQHDWFVYVFNKKSSNFNMSITIPFFCDVARNSNGQVYIKEFGVNKSRAQLLWNNGKS